MKKEQPKKKRFQPPGKIKREHKTKTLAEIATAIEHIDAEQESSKVDQIRKLAHQRDLIKALLNDRQLAFCSEYLKDRNGTKAMVRAGYSQNTASSQATEVLGIPEVTEFIKISQKILDLDTGVTQEWIVEEFKKLAAITAKDLYDDSGNLIPPHLLPDHVAAAISEVKQKLIKKVTDDNGKVVAEVFEFAYKLHPKVAALDALGKFKGIYERDNKQRTPEGGVLVYLPDNGRDANPAPPTKK
jgi:phage terminase small subunit